MSIYNIQFHENHQMLSFSGTIRPQEIAEISFNQISDAAKRVMGVLYMDFKRLEHLNNIAFNAMVIEIDKVLKARSDLRIKFIVSSVVPWSKKRFSALVDLYQNNISVEQYDDDFYPGQAVIENDTFIPVLRTQTEIIWSEEKHYLRRHGLKEGMKIADVCCGIGDFAVLVAREFNPQLIVAIDHSKPNLQYARNFLEQHGQHGKSYNIEYHYGDAVNILQPDNEFDFVTCRLSLQIFNKPEAIINELIRICKPGGRIYLTSETYSKTFGYPRTKSIEWTYQEASGLFGQLQMDLEYGIKMQAALVDAGLYDLKVESMMITTNSQNRESFKTVVESWKAYICNDLAVANGRDEEYRAKLSKGFDDHIHAITSQKGFSGWPIWVASACKA